MIVAHQGASRHAPANTIPAFYRAWDDGADAIEGDFHLTKDGHIVCIHDDNTRRVAGTNKVIKNTTLKELRKLDVGTYHDKQFAGTTIPTIAEVFAAVPQGKKIYIEIKCGPSIIAALLDAIRKSGLQQEQVVIIAFDKKVVRDCKNKAPQFKTLWLSGFEINEDKQITPSARSVLKTLKEIKADGFSSSASHIDEPFIKSILDGGYEYHVWTIDDVEVARRFVKWGAMSITTNVPGEMGPCWRRI